VAEEEVMLEQGPDKEFAVFARSKTSTARATSDTFHALSGPMAAWQDDFLQPADPFFDTRGPDPHQRPQYQSPAAPRGIALMWLRPPFQISASSPSFRARECPVALQRKLRIPSIWRSESVLALLDPAPLELVAAVGLSAFAEWPVPSSCRNSASAPSSPPPPCARSQ